MLIFRGVKEFDWDKGNSGKNQKHGVSDGEAEEVFFDGRKKIFKDALHSKTEERFIFFGKTKKGRLLFLVFTIRSEKIRIISARKVNKKEVKIYEEKT